MCFDLKKLPINLPIYYEECLRCFAEYSCASRITEQALCQEIHDTVIWNNKYICIQGRSIFYEELFKKGIITLGDLTTKENAVFTGFQIITSSSLTFKEKFQIMAIIDALPAQWRQHLKTCNGVFKKNFRFSSNAQLYLNDHNVNLDKVIFKSIYNEVRSKNEGVPTAQLRYTETYCETLKWEEIYRIPFKVAIDSRSREFQYKILHRYLATNKFLHKIGLVPIEHLLIKCEYSDSFRRELNNWLNTIEIKIKALSHVDKMFGFWNRQVDFYLLNHLLNLGKQHIYFCRNKEFPPSLKIFLAKVSSVYLSTLWKSMPTKT